jgi:hypothetical protein
MAQRKWSYRSEMLKADITVRADLTRSCNSCSDTFSCNSDVAAWKGHYRVKHNRRFLELEAIMKMQQARTVSEVDDTVSVISSAAAASVATASTSNSSSSSSRLSSSSKKQRTLVSMMQPTQQQSLDAIAAAFAVNSVAHAAIETPEFINMLRVLGYSGSLPSRKMLRNSIVQLAGDTRTKVAEQLRGAVVTLAADGWTNVKRQKITNIVPVVNGVAYYWSSIVNTGENTAEWLAAQLLPVILSLSGEYGARVVGVVVDNEAVNGAAHRLLLPDLPFLIHVPCAAHTVQLVVRSCLSKPELASTVQQFVELVRLFDAKQHRIALRKMQEAHEVKLLVVQKPCDTRWSSLLTSAERMLLLEKEVVHVCLEALPSITAEFWLKLRTLISFLKPFQVATDRIQRDFATLYTVYEQFTMLREHATKYPWARSCIDERWEKRVHVEAVTASAMLSFVEPVGLDKQAAQQFIVDFGTAYIFHYQLAPQKSQLQISDALTMQIAEFNGREGLFRGLNDRIDTAKRVATAERAAGWSPRKVWLLYSELELGIVAAALLSISASEAAVERTFSSQGLLHSDRRNALGAASVEAEMMLKFNARTLLKEPPTLFAGVINMPEDASKEEEDAATVVPEELQDGEEGNDHSMQLEDEVMDIDEPVAAAAAAAVPSRRALLRQPSVTFRDVPDFLAWFIKEQKLTKASTINANVEMMLSGLSDRLKGTPGTATLRMRLLEALAALPASS